MALARYSMLKVMLIIVTLVANLRSSGENPHESGAGRGKMHSDAVYVRSKLLSASLVGENQHAQKLEKSTGNAFLFRAQNVIFAIASS